MDGHALMRRTSVSITCHRLSDEERQERRLVVCSARCCGTSGKAEASCERPRPGADRLLRHHHHSLLVLLLLLFLLLLFSRFRVLCLSVFLHRLSRSVANSSGNEEGSVRDPREKPGDGVQREARYAREFAE